MPKSMNFFLNCSLTKTRMSGATNWLSSISVMFSTENVSFYALNLKFSAMFDSRIAENYEKRDLSNRGFKPWALVYEAKDHPQRSTYSSKSWMNQSRNILGLR